MKKILILLIVSYTYYGAAAHDTPKPKNDTWYVWLQAVATIEGKETMVVSKEVFTTYCCVNSSEYSKLIKRSRKWMQKNIDPNYVGLPLQKVQDRDLAKRTLEKLKATPGAHIVDFSESCK